MLTLANEEINLFFANYSYIIAIIVFFIILAFTVFLFLNKKKERKISHDKFMKLFVANNVINYESKDDCLIIEVEDKNIVKTHKLYDYDFHYENIDNKFIFKYSENEKRCDILKIQKS